MHHIMTSLPNVSDPELHAAPDQSYIDSSPTFGTTRHDTTDPKNAVSYILSDEFVCVTMGLRSRASECYRMAQSLKDMNQIEEAKSWNDRGLEADRVYENLTHRWAASA